MSIVPFNSTPDPSERGLSLTNRRAVERSDQKAVVADARDFLAVWRAERGALRRIGANRAVVGQATVDELEMCLELCDEAGDSLPAQWIVANGLSRLTDRNDRVIRDFRP